MTGSDQHDAARDRDPDSLTGEVRSPGAPARPFIGWIGLLSALQAAIKRLKDRGATEDEVGGQVTVAIDVEADPERASSHPQSNQER
jgi:hypothetical protein